MASKPPKNEVCARAECEQPTPLDMSGIALDNTLYCSPDCARAALRENSEAPAEVTLFDPQFRADRAQFPSIVEEDQPTVTMHVTSQLEALDVVDTFDEAHQPAFRVSTDRVNLKVSPPTKDCLDSVKQDDETWDECMRRLAQLHRATQVD